MNRTPRITEEDIQRALRRFRQDGRLIRKLPDQAAPRSRMVGVSHSAYEIVGEGEPGTDG